MLSEFRSDPDSFPRKRFPWRKIGTDFAKIPAWHCCAYALAIEIRVSYDSSTAESSRYRHGIFSRIEPGRKPCGSRSTCHCHVDLSNRSAVEKVALKVAFAKRKQLAQKTVGSREHRTSRVCSGLVGGVAQGCNIRSPVALA